MDGVTASDSEEESIENFTNDPLPLEEATKKTTRKRGYPKKGQYVPPTINYNTRSQISISEATAIAAASTHFKFLVDDQRLATSGMTTVGSWASECENMSPKHSHDVVS